MTAADVIGLVMEAIRKIESTVIGTPCATFRLPNAPGVDNAVPVGDQSHDSRDVRVADDLLQVVVNRILANLRNNWHLCVAVVGE